MYRELSFRRRSSWRLCNLAGRFDQVTDLPWDLFDQVADLPWDLFAQFVPWKEGEGRRGEKEGRRGRNSLYSGTSARLPISPCLGRTGRG